MIRIQKQKLLKSLKLTLQFIAIIISSSIRSGGVPEKKKNRKRYAPSQCTSRKHNEKYLMIEIFFSLLNLFKLIIAHLKKNTISFILQMYYHIYNNSLKNSAFGLPNFIPANLATLFGSIYAKFPNKFWNQKI